jgi:phosphinothricin acetyltransferase
MPRPGLRASVRPAAETDFPAIASITNHYIATTSIHFGYEPVTAAELRSSWRSSDRHPWLVAVEDDRVLGYAKAGVWRARDAYQWTTELGLYIAPSHHRLGLGRALYTDLLSRLAQLGFHSAIGGITLPNEPSISLHLSLGFTHVGTVLDAGFKHSSWHAVAFYQRLL